MRKLLTFNLTLTLVFLCAYLPANAQQELLAKEDGNKSKAGEHSTRNLEKRNALHARNSIMVIMNGYKELTNAESITEESLTNANAADNSTSGSFKDYLEKMDVILKKRLTSLSGPDEFVNTQKARIKGGLNMLMSSKCLENQDKNNFVLTKDLEGNDIVSFPVDSLRKSTRFGTVDNYREGFARVRKDQVYGYLNICGDENITCQYAKAEPFNGGRALVKRVEWYYIDGEGNESEALANIVDGKAITNGVTLAKFADGKFALIDNNYDVTKKAISLTYESIEPFYKNAIFKVRNGKKIGLIGLDGKVKLEVNYDNIEATKLNTVYRLAINGQVGLIDTSWTIKTPPAYNSISEFNQFGMATAVNGTGMVLIQKNTFKTTKIYENITNFNEFGVAVYRDGNKKHGLIDAEMKVIVEPKYASIGNFNELGLAAACLEPNKCGFIKFDGTEQIKANYDIVSNFNAFGLAVVKTYVDSKVKVGEKVGAEIIIDSKGNVIVPQTDESIAKKYHYTLTDSLHSDNFIIVNATINDSRTPELMLINKHKMTLITSAPFESIISADLNGNLRVKRGDMWGIIDTMGTVKAKCTYKEIRRVGEGYYAAQNEKGMWGFLNKNGKPQIEFEYEEVRQYRNGYAPVSKGKNQWGIINKFNAKIVPCVFKSITLNGAETKFEVTDVDGTVYIVNEKAECESNCAKFESIRNKANKQE